jgi:hypothetical protein
MFYPEAFPEGAPKLTARETVEMEFAAMCLLLQADRSVLARLTPPQLASALLEHLEYSGIVPPHLDAAVAGLLQANSSALSRFVAHHLLPAASPTDLRWLSPDPGRVRAHLGDAAVAEWRRRAEGEAESVTGQLVREAARVAAA